MLKIKKGFSLIESLVALFVLSMITLVYTGPSIVTFAWSEIPEFN